MKTSRVTADVYVLDALMKRQAVQRQMRLDRAAISLFFESSASQKLPVVKHIYQNWAMESSRWNFFVSRAGDIVVAITYKAGTTWAQAIVANLIFSRRKLPSAIHDKGLRILTGSFHPANSRPRSKNRDPLKAISSQVGSGRLPRRCNITLNAVITPNR